MKGFEKIVGHEKVKEYLNNAIQSGKVSNAYIFSGSKGLGKFRVAKIFAQNLQHTEDINIVDCIVIDSGGKNIGVDIVRERIIDDIVIQPMESKYKIYIVKNAQKMTVQAQNALLKTLEEPPEYGIIILICNDERKLLDTIKSRSVTLHFTSPSVEDATKCIIEKTEISPEDATMLAKLTDCNIGQAIRYSNIFKNKDQISKLMHALKHLSDMRNYEIFSFIKQLSEDERAFFMQLLFCLYRDMLNYKLSNDPNGIILKMLQIDIMKWVKNISYNNMYEAIDAIVKAIERIDANANIESVLEVLLMTIKEKNNANNYRG